MKRLIFTLMMMASVLTVSAQKYYGKVVDPDGYTNIRKSASTSSAIVGRYNSGEYLYYTPLKSGWSKVYSGAKSSTYLGYMHTSRIKRINPNSSYDSTPSTKYYSGYITDPTDYYVNLRKGPGTDYAIIGRLDVGTFVYYTKNKTNWRKVYDRKKNYLGYVYYDRID